MEHDFTSSRISHRGWEIRSQLSRGWTPETVSARAELFMGDRCRCHLVSCRQFGSAAEAIEAIERKAALWIDEQTRDS